MFKTDDRSALIELGSVSGDTQGPGGVILEGFTLMPKDAITAE